LVVCVRYLFQQLFDHECYIIRCSGVQETSGCIINDLVITKDCLVTTNDVYRLKNNSVIGNNTTYNYQWKRQWL